MTNIFSSFSPSSFMLFGGISVLFFVVLLIIWMYAFYSCIKWEKDIKTRNIWLAIIIAGKILGAVCYIVLERVLYKKTDRDKSSGINQ
jgi:hypothetical protein